MSSSRSDSHSDQRRRRARVAVLLDASNTPHYLDNGREPYDRVAHALPWVKLEFFDQHSFTPFKDAVEQRRVHAFVIASGSLDAAEMRNLVLDESFVSVSHESIRAGMGAVVLHQHPPTSGSLNYGFLPDELTVDVSCAHTDEHELTAEAIECIGPLDIFGPANILGGVEKVEATTQLTGEQLAQVLRVGQRGKPAWHRDRLHLDTSSWHILAREREDGDLLLVRSRLPGISVVLSALPLDWNRSDLLSSLVALAVREQGCLYLRAEPESEKPEDSATDEKDAATVEPYLQHLQDDGLFVAEQRVPSEVLKGADCDLHACSLGAFFGTLAFSTAWHLPDLPWLSNDDILARLERKGGLAVCCLAAAGRDMLIEIAQPPAYAQHAESFAAWIAGKLVRPEHVSAFELRAILSAVEAIEGAFRDPGAVPRAVARDQLAALLAAEIEERAREGHIETDPLRTAAVLAVVTFLDVNPELARVASELRSWLSVETHFKRAAPYELIQALVWNDDLWEAPLGNWLRNNCEHWSVDPDLAGRPYTLILELRHGALDPKSAIERLAEVTRTEANSIVVRGEAFLELARISTSGTDGDATLETRRELTGAKRWLRHRIAALKSQAGSIEPVSVLTAALVEIAKSEALTVTVHERGVVKHTGDIDALTVATARAEQRRGELQRLEQEASDLESQTAWLRAMVAFLVLVTAGTATFIAWKFVGPGASLGTLTGMIGLYVTLAGLAPKYVPQLAALPGARRTSAKRPSGR